MFHFTLWNGSYILCVGGMCEAMISTVGVAKPIWERHTNKLILTDFNI